MKKIIIILLLLQQTVLAQQVWVPNKKPAEPKVSYKVQCWGTTTTYKRCKNIIDTAKPGKADMDSRGIWYCSKHKTQIR